MGNGLQRIAAACGGLTVKSGGEVVRYDAFRNMLDKYRGTVVKECKEAVLTRLTVADLKEANTQCYPPTPAAGK